MKHRPRIIQKAWASYVERVLPPTAGPTQVIETRRAFYAGAASLMTLFWTIGGETVSEDVGVTTLQDVEAELADFMKDVVERRA